MFRKPVLSTPLDGRDALLADLDGVVYRGAVAIPGAVDSLNRVAAVMRVGYITNNASRTDEAVAAHLSSFGLGVEPADVVTSPQAAVRMLVETVPAASVVLVVGGEGLTREVERAGFTLTRTAADSPAAVIQGFAPEVGWSDLAEAAFALHRGIPWIATNTDWTIPLEGGVAPGNGTLVSAVHTAVGRLPEVAGKPEQPIFSEAARRFGAQNPLFVGDRLDTDIVGANRAGMASALVLTGIDGPRQVMAAAPHSRPDFLLDDLAGLHSPYPQATETVHKRTGDRVVTVRGAVVRQTEHRIRIERSGDSRIDLLRAGAIAVWGAGRAIYGLEVETAIYE